ncbi:MAG: TadE/TadG family type IV pilus assembly protein [Alphaproteobacteria bacterium]
MRGFIKALKALPGRWVRETEAVATVEATLVFPILLTILLGTFDMGNGLLANQKAIRASQIVADLVTRNMTVSEEEIEEAITAGSLAFEPLDSSSYGVDIVSIRFDEEAEPEIVWRETSIGMSANQNVLDDVASLAEADNGVVVVTVGYVFEPVFAGFLLNTMPMQETAFARGRRSAVVNLE